MKMNIHFLFCFFIACISFFSDIIIYILKVDYIQALIGSSILFLLILYLLRHKIKLVNDFSKLDIFSILLLLSFLCINGLQKCETIYDTATYHIYLQQNPFTDKVNFDFFPGRIYCCFLFPLGDRMHYIFRYLLGYRAGTIFSYYLVIVLFYEVKQFLNLFINNKNRVSFYANSIWVVWMFVAFIGSYHIDNIGVIFLLEILYQILSTKDLTSNKLKMYLIFLLSGISIGIKSSNCFFVFVFFIFALFRERKNLKNLKIIDYFISGIFIVVPFLIYMIDNYYQTGSILFPYYNSILKSEYFGNYNWVDERFGIPNYKKVIWPIFVSFTKKIYGDEWAVRDPILGIGYIINILYICSNKHKKDKLLNYLVIINFSCILVWIQFLYGYMRYGIINPIMSCIIICILIDKWLCARKCKIYKKLVKFYKIISLYIWNQKLCFKEKINIINKIIFSACSAIFILVFMYSVNVFVNDENFKYIFKDRISDEYKIPIDGVWGTLECFGTYTSTLIRESNTPIYNLDRRYFESSRKALELYQEKMKNNDIYFLLEVDKLKGNFLYELMNNFEENLYDFEIEEELNTYTSKDIPLIDANSKWVLLKLKYIGE